VLTLFPYYNRFSEDRIQNNHYISFLLPDDKNIIKQFKNNITQFSTLYFKSWRFHELLGNDFITGTKSFSNSGWSIPKIIRENRFPSLLSDSYKPRLYKTRNDPDLTVRDFIVLSMLTPNLRKSAKKCANSGVAIDNKISEREVYYRKMKLLEKEAIIPMPYWQDDIKHVIRLEAICNKTSRRLLISAAYECTTFFFGLTSEGIILFLNVPLPHVNEYVKYFKSLLDKMGIIEYSFTLSKNWSTGPSIVEIVKNWNYGPKGFTTAGLNISPNIFDYI
jgi:hypothetical protein